ncbi:acid sphingomyelinase family phosphodiesterase [Entamoeba histolytica HM-3:IMSS]|uniref:Acid sphingomyelinase phosphodiesterase, putative n=2 Tax=Entamoeba histolytica TaxID=5759 RepID=M2R0P8_ENTHI|nr:Acid sphingomyelinase phosphodiesterase, putative [Entamoeba histolytica KU27]EMS15667.1 acid sphingomyelinase family phosphodiesterase [Entamoeba histolytica HM-3:IMSS]
MVIMLLLLLFITLTLANKKFWLITDTHFDDEFTVGSSSKCLAIDCCYSNSIPRKGQENFISGSCGDYNCYSPLNVSESAFDYIAKHQSESKLIFWLMDVVPGDVITQSKETNKKRIQLQVEALKKRLSGFRIYPVPGNHDYWLSSNWQYPPQNQWMLDFMGDLFKDWLSPNALEQFKKGGFYTELIDSGVRIIALYLAYVDVYGSHCNEYVENDPAGMMKWFNETLELARKNGERVILLSHEGVGLKESGTIDVVPKFNEDFSYAMNEYSDIIISHLSGHSHFNSFRVLPNITKPTFHIIMNPAMTSFKNLNLRFRLYEYDRKNIKDYTNYMLNINKCNKNNKFEWEIEYNAKELFGIEEYTTKNLKEFIEQLAVDDELWTKFDSHYSTINRKCEGNCRKDLLCSIHCMKESEFITCINQK